MNTIEYTKRVNGEVVGRYHLLVCDVTDVDLLLESRNVLADKAHGNSRGVVIMGDIDEDTYNHRIVNHGAKPIVERQFCSAKAASRHLGYNWNAVGQAMSRAHDRGEKVAIVAGVPFRWIDEIGGVD